MSRIALITACVLTLCAVAPGLAAADGQEFRGEITRGDTLVHRFEYDGAAYEFRLVPHAGGWTIWISDRVHRDRNYVSVVTPPFRGINPAVIEGWHFRNKDNTGPNAPGPGNVNAPQEERRFAFVRDSAGFQTAQAALEILLWPNGHSPEDIQQAEERLAGVPRVHGEMLIEALELGHLVPGEQAHIERMAFRVRLQSP